MLKKMLSVLGVALQKRNYVIYHDDMDMPYERAVYFGPFTEREAYRQMDIPLMDMLCDDKGEADMITIAQMAWREGVKAKALLINSRKDWYDWAKNYNDSL